MDSTDIKNWLRLKIAQSEDQDIAQKALEYINAIDDIKSEIDAQIEWSSSDVVKQTLKHVRDDIIGRRIS